MTPTDEPPVSALELSEGQRVTRWVYRGIREGVVRTERVEGVVETYGHGWDPDALVLRLPSGERFFGFDLHATEAQCLAAAVEREQIEARTQQENAREALQEADDAIARANRVLQRLREVAG
jgi:hypothetical protein